MAEMRSKSIQDCRSDEREIFPGRPAPPWYRREAEKEGWTTLCGRQAGTGTEAIGRRQAEERKSARVPCTCQLRKCSLIRQVMGAWPAGAR